MCFVQLGFFQMKVMLVGTWPTWDKVLKLVLDLCFGEFKVTKVTTY